MRLIVHPPVPFHYFTKSILILFFIFTTLLYSFLTLVGGEVGATCVTIADDGSCINYDYNNYHQHQNEQVGNEITEDYAACEDLDKLCEFWANNGECRANAEYMLEYCARSCNSCDHKRNNNNNNNNEGENEYGVSQISPPQHATETEKSLQEMMAYFLKLRQDPSTSKKMLEMLDNCKNKHESCAYWKVLGECDNNPGYMKIDCAAVCKTCENLSVETRCPIDPDAPKAWQPGDLHTFFTNITTLPQFQQYEPRIHSQPATEGEDGPWVVTLDNFVTEEEADRLIELGADEGYKRSSDVGAEKSDGTFTENVNSGRTSTNSWCQHQCYKDEIAQRVIRKIIEITEIPETNSEYLQLLRYEVGQFYQTHHDYIPQDNHRQQGVRLLTIFLYLNDVEAGGGTNFPMLDITIMPKKGRALIWPSVLNDYPDQSDERTYHQALRVEKGVKYGANAWIHMHDFKTPNRIGCQ